MTPVTSIEPVDAVAAEETVGQPGFVERRRQPRHKFTASVGSRLTGGSKLSSATAAPASVVEAVTAIAPTAAPADSVVADGAGELGAEPSFVERRSEPRYQFTATVELVDLLSRTRVQARISDLSRGGCYVDTTSPLPVGTSVKMRLSLDDRAFEVNAKVVYSLSGMGMGMSFTTPAAEQLEVLQRWLGELSGEIAPEFTIEDHGQVPKLQGARQDPSYVLGALLMELVRQGVLSADKGKVMLSQLLGNNA